MNVSCKNFLERLIPRTFSCLLRDAEKGQGVFDPANSLLLTGLNNTEYKENLEYIKNGLSIYKQSIGNKMRDFTKAKEELLEEVTKLNKYMEMVVLARLPAVDVLKVVLNLQSVFYRFID